jgi:hypothetical protein
MKKCHRLNGKKSIQLSLKLMSKLRPKQKHQHLLWLKVRMYRLRKSLRFWQPQSLRQNKLKQDQATVWRAVFSGVQSGELPPERAYSLVDEYANKFVTQPDKVQKIRKRIGEMTGEPYEDFVLKSETQIAATPSASGSR